MRISLLLSIVQLIAILMAWSEYGSSPIRLELFGFDLRFLFMASLPELKPFYPNLYWLIYAVSRSLIVGVPMLLVGITVMKRSVRERLSDFGRAVWGGDVSGLSGRLLIPFLMTLSISIMAYYGLRSSALQPVRFQTHLARGFLLINLLNLIILVLFNWDWTVGILKNFLFENVRPYSLAVVRILFFTYSVVLNIGFLFSKASNMGMLEKQPLPGIGWLIDLIPVNPTIYAAFAISGALFALIAAVGYRTRLFMILHAVTIFYVVATPNFFGKLWHEQIVIWIAWILAASPCADVWSLDARLGRVWANETNSGYGFHLRMIWLHFGLIYLFAGFFKLWESGFDWALNDTVVNLVTIEWFEHYDKIAQPRIDRFPHLIKAGALLTIVFELSYVFLLFRTRWRWLAIGGGLLMHNLIGHFMYIAFFGMLQVFYLVYVPWNWLFQKLRFIKDTGLPARPTAQWTRPAILIPVVILVANFFCGIFRINSYPFSIYPVYTDVVSDTVAYFDYRVLDKGKETLHFRQEGRRYRFRWENYSRMEYDIIRRYLKEDALDTVAVRTMWRRWQLEVPPLAELDSVEVFLFYRYVSPDSTDVPVPPKYLMTIVD